MYQTYCHKIILQNIQKDKMIQQQNSEDEQGFIATKLVAKLSGVDDIRDSKSKQCKMFTPFYLSSGLGNMKLEIPQSLNQIEQLQIEQQNKNQNFQSQKEQRQLKIKRNYSKQSTLWHPYRIYSDSNQFCLIYSKNSSEQPLKNDFQYINNDILLQTAQIKKQDLKKNQQYQKRKQIANIFRNPFSKPFKPFQYPSNQNIYQPSTSAIIQNNNARTLIPRNNSNKSQNTPNNSQLLAFDSRFQAGNLYCVYYKIDSKQYHLFIQNDTNSYGYNQWFYFSLTNIKKDIEYKFIIINFKKRNSFFRVGFKPAVFSLKKYQQNKNTWSRKGNHINYEDSNITTSKFFKFYKLTFTLQFQYDDDYVLVAANLPYSYTKLSNYLNKFVRNYKESKIYDDDQTCDFKVTTIGRTFCGNNVPQIIISPTSKQRKQKSPCKSKRKGDVNKKKMIIFLGRQHPGETVSSYLMEHILQNISTYGHQLNEQKGELNQSQIQRKENIKYLLKNYTIVVYPMINVDGVIYGNSRCDVTGMDLNRRWNKPSKLFHPQVYNIKNKIQNLSKKYDIVACFDLHGHSKLYNVFCYSCKIKPVSCRILPFLISLQTNKFHFPHCTFGITRYKSSTARATIFKTIKNQNVLTIQMSYFGFIENNQNSSKKNNKKKETLIKKNQKPKIHYFQPSTFHQISVGILKGLVQFLDRQNSKKYLQVQKQINQNIQQILSYQKIYSQADDQKGSGSQSDPECDQIDFQTKINTILGKEFQQQAEYFKPAQQQSLDISSLLHTKSMLFGKNQSPIHTKNMSKQFLNSQKQVLQKIQPVNKIRISKRKNEPKNRTLSNQKFKSQLMFNSTIIQRPPKENSKKQTISYTVNKDRKMTTHQQRLKKKRLSEHQSSKRISERLYSQNKPRIMFAENRLNPILIHDNNFQKQQQRQSSPTRVYDDLIIFSAQSKQFLNYEKSNLLEKPSIITPDNQFFIKFQKFLPSHPLPHFNKKQKLSFLQQSIYKDDQRQVLNTLLQNKKKLQMQKKKRQIQKTKALAQRYHRKQCLQSNKQFGYGKNQENRKKFQMSIIGHNSKEKQDVVDFKRFKDRNKLKMQLKQADQAYIRYMKKQGFY